MLLQNYENSKIESQMFFSCQLTAEEILESLRRTKLNESPTPSQLRDMFKAHDFNLSFSYCDSSDCMISAEIFRGQRPEIWMKFLRSLLPQCDMSEENNPVLMEKLDAIFQILFFIIHNGQRPTPLHVNVVQTTHHLSRSKELIEMLNGLGLCYDYKHNEGD